MNKKTQLFDSCIVMQTVIEKYAEEIGLPDNDLIIHKELKSKPLGKDFGYIYEIIVDIEE